jgi:hypothetical protein
VTAYEVKYLKISGNSLTMIFYFIRLENVIQDYDMTVRQINSQFLLDANYETSQNKVKEPRIELLDSAAVAFDCINCYSTGNANFALKIRGTGNMVESYTLELNGKVKANLDLELEVIRATNLTSHKLKKNILQHISLHPISVPGK